MRIPFAFLLMACLSVPAFAAEAPGNDAGSASGAREQQPGACHDEIQKFCGQVKPGEGRVARCVQENEKNLSPACRSALEKQRAERPAAKPNTCRADIEKFCKGQQDGSGGALRCLREHEKDLSEGCRASLRQRAQAKQRAQ